MAVEIFLRLLYYFNNLAPYNKTTQIANTYKIFTLLFYNFNLINYVPCNPTPYAF